jgi:cytochrome o ubiquinol oxidase subunit 3
MTKHHSSHVQEHPDPYHGMYSRTIFGFWIYLLTDFVLFGVLFACFAVLRHSTFGGPGAKELLDLNYAITQTVILLCCSLLAGLGGVAAHRKNKKETVIFFSLLFLFGLLFFIFEIADFQRLIQSGNSWQRSAFLSAFFTLLGTHGLHIAFGLLWIPVLLFTLVREGIEPSSIRRLTCLRMFWQFLNIVWVFIFTIVFFLGRG